MTFYKKKLIEVALPLDAINKASAREKSIRHGHPSTLHLWWARRPLAAARAVIFAQMVDDPSGHPDEFPTEEAQEAERQRLFRIIEELVLWENTTNEEVLQKARDEIWKSWRRTCAENTGHPRAAELFNPDKLPAFHDPFAGGGSLPLEAQRLGLEAFASDLNPVAVLINKAMIEIPPKFAGRPPVHPPHPPTPSPTRGEGESDVDGRANASTPTVPPSRAPSGTAPPANAGGSPDAEGEPPRLHVPESLRRRMVELARQYRREPTRSEAMLWRALRGKKLAGVKFRRQQPIGPFVVDFYAAAHRLIVEVDGPIHAAQQAADHERQQLLETLGLRVVRLPADVVEADLPAALNTIRAFLQTPPSPPVGEGGRGDEGEPPRQQPFWQREWRGAQGLAEDVRYYGQWMRDEAEKRIGHLYPKVDITAEMAHDRPDLKQYVGRQLTVIAWLWARTVKSPNPAFAHVDVPLASTFMLSTKKGKEAYVEPVIEGGDYRFTVRVGKPTNTDVAKKGTKIGRGTFRCLMSETPVTGDYIKAEGRAGRMGARLMAVVAKGTRQRVYLPPTEAMEEIARQAEPEWKPEGDVPRRLTGGTCVPYGLSKWSDLFTPRQLVALTTFSDLVGEAMERVRADAVAAGMPDDNKGLNAGGAGARAYAEAVAGYTAFGVSRTANRAATICIWNRIGQKIEQVFARQAIPMTWDYAESNVLSDSTGGWTGSLEWIPKVLEALSINAAGEATQADAATQVTSVNKIVSTDPPYYDNIGYADLSDFFYVWLRRSLKSIFPNLFATLAVPKAEELVATSYRQGTKTKAEAFFLDGMTRAMSRLTEQVHPAFLVTIYYAFKQSERKGDTGLSSTGWETFLDAIIRAGLGISGTWPMRTERDFGMKTGSNVLASSIVLVCRKRHAEAPTATRREFVAALKAELPAAVKHLQRGNIAPVDLAQAAIGPGMAIFTRYDKVLDAEGQPLPVREALALINRTLDEVLAEQEGDFDADTRWALAWFEQSGFDEGEYGVAETLSKAKNTSVQGMVAAGILHSGRGKVRLLRPDELPEDWDPATDPRLTAWEVVHHLIRVLEAGGEGAAAELTAKLGSRAEAARDLAYRLYTICERKKRAAEALSYNSLVQSWGEVTQLARERAAPQFEQQSLGI